MITPEQREQRRKFIGSSDVAAILGKDPWRTDVDVYISKIEHLEDRANKQQYAGNRLERPVLEWAAEQLSETLIYDQFRTSQNGSVLAANHDALIVNKPQGVEAKTTGILHYSPDIAAQWGEPGTDDVPDHVLLQCQAQAYVSNLELVWVPCLIGGRGFQMFRVEANDRLMEAIVIECERFWREHVVARVMPSGNAPSLDVVKSVRRQPNKVAALSVESVEQWGIAKAEAELAAEAERRALAKLLAELGDAEAGDCDLGRFTYFEQSRKEHTVKASTFRVPRFKENKKGNAK